MNYELAKKLKEAGFPLQEHAELSIRDSNLIDGIMIDFPTLSELIEAVGMPNVAGSISCSNKEWYAVIKTKNEYGIEYEGRGSTPKEAVAELWLALKGRN